MASKTCRMHELAQPQIKQVTMARFDSADGSIVYIRLAEYDNEKCLIPFQNLGIKLSHDETVESGFRRAFLRVSDNKYMKQFPVRITNTSPLEVDMNVSEADKQLAVEQYSKLSRLQEFARQLFGTFNVDTLSLESIYRAVIWRLADPFGTLQTTIEDAAFLEQIQPLIDAFYEEPLEQQDQEFVDTIPKDVFVRNFRNIQSKRFVLQAVKITADLTILARWSVLGIQSIKETLIQAKQHMEEKFVPDLEKNEEPFTIAIVTAPKYQISLSICKRELGHQLMQEFIDEVRATFAQQHVDFEASKIRDAISAK